VVTAQTQYNLKNAKEYFEEHLCVGDYYNEGEQVTGEWFGQGGERLGLSGKVRADEFLRLCENQHPAIANSMAEMFTMQRYLQPDALKKHNLHHFDSWAATFGERLVLDINDASKCVKELGEKVGAKFEREDRFQELTRRQGEIEKKLDLTKNQAPSQIEAVENGESKGISEKLGAGHQHTAKSKRGVKV
jgi:hypothetical protein